MKLEKASGSAPGKTFLLGEYLAISGGPSILLSTEPRFSFRSFLHPHLEAHLPEASPAANYLRMLKAPGRYEWTDPHGGAGGLGASSAQFALLYASHLRGQGVAKGEWLKPSRLAEMLNVYRECAWSGEGLPPSGADVVSHFSGGVTYFDGRSKHVTGLEWTFENLTFSLFRTGYKLPTHLHLREGKKTDDARFAELVAQALRAFQESNSTLLTEAVHQYRVELEGQNLTAEATLELLRSLDQIEGVRAAKGCGALGADVILVLHAPAAGANLAAWSTQKRMDRCGSLAELSPGLEVSVQIGGGR